MTVPPTVQQQNQLQLSSSLSMTATTTAVIFLFFPILRYCMPRLFMPFGHLKTKNTKIWGKIFWFLDVFIQPLSVYSVRGNFATILVIFQNLVSLLYLILTGLSLCVLMPVYQYGTGQSFVVSYLSIWSTTSITHLEGNSLMNIIPIIAIVFISLVTMTFYYQFTLIYVFFRQRILKRSAPQNYVVLLQNIPHNIDNKQLLQNVISSISKDTIIHSVPASSQELLDYYQNIVKFEDNYKIKKLQSEMNDAIIEHNDALGNSVQTQLRKKEQLISDEYDVIQGENKEFKKIVYLQQQDLNQQSLPSKYKVDYPKQTFSIKSVNDQFDYLPKLLSGDICKMRHSVTIKKDIVEENLNVNKKDVKIQKCIEEIRSTQFVMNRLQHMISKSTKQTSKNNPENYVNRQEIGRAAFLICSSPEAAAEKYSALISDDLEIFTASIAPAAEDINWKNMAIRNSKRSCLKFAFYVISIVMFVIIFAIQFAQEIYEAMYGTKLNLYLKTKLCPGQTQFNDLFGSPGGFLCGALTSTISQWFYYVFTIVLQLLPSVVAFICNIAKPISNSVSTGAQYQLLYLYLILLFGISTIVQPSIFPYQTSPQFSITFVYDFLEIVQNIGEQIITSMFNLINYIITMYCSYSIIFDLLNVVGIIQSVLKKITKKNSIEWNSIVRPNHYDFIGQFAYIAHMFTLGYLSTITVPLVNAVILFIYIVKSAIVRYNVLNAFSPGDSSDISNQSNILISVQNCFYYGLMFMLTAIPCYYVFRKVTIGYVCIIVCIICIFVVSVIKIRIDQNFKRALTQLSRGQYVNPDRIWINPCQWQMNVENNSFKPRKMTELDLCKDTDQAYFDNCYKTKDDVRRKQIDNKQLLDKKDDPPTNYSSPQLQKQQIKVINLQNKNDVAKRIGSVSNALGKLLGLIFVDLSCLPVSVSLIDPDDGVAVFKVQEEQMLQNYKLNQEISEGEQANIVKLYTHPAVQLYEALKDEKQNE